MTTKAPKPTPPLTELQRHVLDYLHVFLALNSRTARLRACGNGVVALCAAAAVVVLVQRMK